MHFDSYFNYLKMVISDYIERDASGTAKMEAEMLDKSVHENVLKMDYKYK